MRKMCAAAIIAAALAIMFLSGCAARYETLEQARADGAVLGESIAVDGVDISGMSIEQAETALKTAHTSYISGINYTLSAGADSVSFTGGQLPVDYSPDAAILSALNAKKYWPASMPAREYHGEISVNAEKLRALVAEYAKQLEHPPVDAKVSYENGGFTYTPALEGQSVDSLELAERLGTLWREGGEYRAVTHAVEPTYTVEQAKADTKLISEFSTSFEGSTYGKKNRVFNIVKAAMLVDGTVVEPGESFDMNAVLGDRNAQNGWELATAIRDGDYTQEYGGGVCQVSTTLYNAVLMADLEIVERHHHSWPLGYVDIGRDATISTDGPNFIFKNTTRMPLYVSARTDEKQKTVSVRIYGRKTFEGMIRLSSEKVETLSAPGYETQLDNTLSPGASVEGRKARRGSISETYKHYYDNEGQLVKTELVCRDKYRSVKGLMLLAPDVYYGASAVALPEE